MPSLADAELFTSYAGMYTETPDGYPVIDRVGGVEGLYLVGAFNGYGFKISPAVGIVVAEMVTKGESRMVDVSSLGVGRFGVGARERVGHDRYHGPSERRSREEHARISDAARGKRRVSLPFAAYRDEGSSSWRWSAYSAGTGWRSVRSRL